MNKFWLVIWGILMVLAFVVGPNYESIIGAWNTNEEIALEVEYNLEESELSRKMVEHYLGEEIEVTYQNTLRINNSIAQGDWWFQLEKDVDIMYAGGLPYVDCVRISHEELRKHFGMIGNEYELALKGFKALKEARTFPDIYYTEGMPFYLIPQSTVANMSFEERCEILGKRNFLSKSEEEWLSMTEESIAMLTEQEWLELAGLARYFDQRCYTLAERVQKEENGDLAYEVKFQFAPVDVLKVLPAGEYEATVILSYIGEFPITLIVEEDVDAGTMAKYNLNWL